MDYKWISITIIALLLLIFYKYLYFLAFLPLFFVISTWPLLISGPILIYIYDSQLKKFKIKIPKYISELILALGLKFIISDLYYLVYYIIFNSGPAGKYLQKDYLSFHIFSFFSIWLGSRILYWIITKAFLSFKTKKIYRWFWMIVILSIIFLYFYVLSIPSLD